MATNTPPPPQIAIDPALQQSSSYYNQYTHYPSAAYNAQSYSQPPQQSGSGSGSGGRGSDNDLANMNDALGSAGIDLRAEEESLHRASTPGAAYRSMPMGDRTRTQSSISPFFLSTSMQAICSHHGLQKKVPDDTVNYLALAARMRLEEIVEKMVRVAKHRESARFDREPGIYTADGSTSAQDDPEKNAMWSVKIRRDVKKQLEALEKADREDELTIRRERKERQDAATAALDSLNQAGGGPMDIDDEDGMPTKKRRKKDGGPGVQAKNLSEDVRKKLSDDTASQAAGRKKYAWMTSGSAGGANRASPKPSGSGGATSTGGWARAFTPRKSQLGEQQDKEEIEVDERMVVTLRDAMFVVCGERGHGGGRGAIHGYI